MSQITFTLQAPKGSQPLPEGYKKESTVNDVFVGTQLRVTASDVKYSKVFVNLSCEDDAAAFEQCVAGCQLTIGGMVVGITNRKVTEAPAAAVPIVASTAQTALSQKPLPHSSAAVAPVVLSPDAAAHAGPVQITFTLQAPKGSQPLPEGYKKESTVHDVFVGTQLRVTASDVKYSKVFVNLSCEDDAAAFEQCVAGCRLTIGGMVVGITNRKVTAAPAPPMSPQPPTASAHAPTHGDGTPTSKQFQGVQMYLVAASESDVLPGSSSEELQSSFLPWLQLICAPLPSSVSAVFHDGLAKIAFASDADALVCAQCLAKSSFHFNEIETRLISKQELKNFQLESRILKMPHSINVRLPSFVVSEICSLQHTLQWQFQLVIQQLSAVGVSFCGKYENVMRCIAHLCQLNSVKSTTNVDRLIVECFPFVRSLPEHLSSAKAVWLGRRIFDFHSGNFATVVDIKQRDCDLERSTELVLTICNQQPVTDDTFSVTADEQSAVVDASDDATNRDLLASSAFVWDHVGMSDAITVLHQRAENSELSLGFIRRLFSRVTEVESAEILESKGDGSQAFCISRVVFNTLKDPMAPARAVSMFHGVRINGFQLGVYASKPITPIKVSARLPKSFRMAEMHSLQAVNDLFARQDVQVTPVAGDAKKFDVKFMSSAACIDARLQLEPKLAAATSLSLTSIHHLLLENCPKHANPEAIVDRLLELCKMPHVKSSIQLSHSIFRGFLRIKCIFPAFSEHALAIAAAIPWFFFEERSSGLLSSCQITTEALMELVRREHVLERIRETRHPDGDDADDNWSQLSLDDEGSASSAHSPPRADSAFANAGFEPPSSKHDEKQQLSVAQKLERLAAILQKCSSGDANAENVSGDLQKVVADLWPVHRIRRKCQCVHFCSAELGRVCMPCQNDLTCQYEHILGACKNPKCNKEAHCRHLIHSFDLEAILRLDVKLENIFRRECATSGLALSLDSLKKCLQMHRKQMFDDSAALLARHSDRLTEMKARLDAASQSSEGLTLEDAVKNSKTAQAIQASCSELQKQIDEFLRARACFVDSNPHSFHEARLFAREVYNRFKTCLPIYAEKSTIIRALSDDFAVLVLSAETGSGKSTQVVQYLSGTVSQRIICTQPRRVAAITLADRVAEEMMTLAPSDQHENLVECKEKKSQSKIGKSRPQIQFMTDFTLLHELYFNPRLPNVSAVVVDEVHERSVNTDILIALLRRTLQLRKSDGQHPFKLVLTSATMKHELFAKYFATNEWDASSPQNFSMAPVLKVGGRTFPVDVFYEDSCSLKHYVQHAEQKACALHAEEPATNLANRENHDILVFLTQPDEVDRVVSNIAAQLPDALVVPLHGGLDREEQKIAFLPADPSKFKRKIVVCTNIAETSVTIDGIGVVIDCGFSKQARYDSSKDATVLTVDFISKSSAKQRAGRAGRTAPGKCFRLYSAEDHEKMAHEQPAELVRADATQAILTVLRLIQNHTDWVADIRNFPFVEHPGVERLNRAMKLLFHLGAIENVDSSALTANGKMISRMNVPPRVAACLMLAGRLDVIPLVSAALGMVSISGSLFRRSKDDQEILQIQATKKSLCEQFPVLGDVGLGLAVFLQSQEVPAQELKKWCRQRFINYFTLQDGIKLVRSYAKEMIACVTRDLSDPAATASFAKAKDDQLSSASIQVHMNDLIACIASGFFGNIAFYLPPRPDVRSDLPPSYFLPMNTQLAFTSKAASFRASNVSPQICFYMEVVESKGVYISSLIGLPDGLDLPQILPDSYRTSSDFQQLLAQNSRRQFLQRPAVVSSKCSVAFKKMLGFKADALKKLETKCRKEFQIAADVELILEPHLPKSMLFIMCSDENKLQAVSAHIQRDLDAIAERLKHRVREVAICGTSMRAVIGSGGECKELLLKPSQSISVRFSATNITHRLSAPITSLARVPNGFFSDLVTSFLSNHSPNVTDDEVRNGGIPSSQYYSIAAAKRLQAVDLQSMSIGQIVSAIEYTAGPICYAVNPLLRSCNETACRPYQGYIRALLQFFRLRSSHPRNKIGVDRVLFRGCALPEDQKANYKPGMMVVWPAFTSTTLDESVAKSFGGGPGSYVFKISTSSYCPLMDVSVFPGEKEILFPAFSHFIIESVLEDDDGYIVVQMKFVRPEDAPINVESPVALLDEVSGDGPIVIRMPQGLEGLQGVASVLQEQLSALDPHMDIDVGCDSKNFWAQVCFSSSELAARATKRFHHSIIGHFEISTMQFATPTDQCPFRCLVHVTLSAVPHTGACFINLHDAAAVARLCPTGRSKFALENGCTVFLQNRKDVLKGETVIPGWLCVSKIPQNYDRPKLLGSFRRYFPHLMLFDIGEFIKNKDQMKKEDDMLLQTGVHGICARSNFLASVAGSNVDYIQDRGIKNGARFDLWYHSPEDARAAAHFINGKIMQQTNLSACASSSLDCDIVFPADVFPYIEPDFTALRDAIVQQYSKTQKMSIYSQKLKNGIKVSISSDDVNAVLHAYSQLASLHRGKIIPIAASLRHKAFSPFQKDKVNQFTADLSKRHQVYIKLAREASCIHVIGNEQGQLAAAAEIERFLATSIFDVTLGVPFKAIAAIKKRVSEGFKGVMCVLMERQIIVSGVDVAAVQEVCGEVRALFPPRGDEQECCVCLCPSNKTLGTCGHALCSECGSNYVESKIMDREVPVTCPYPDCQAKLLSEDLFAMTGSMVTLHDAAAKGFLMRHSSQYTNCHTLNCPQFLKKSGESVCCSLCLRSQCPLCGKNPHKGYSCEDAENVELRSAPAEEHRKKIIEDILMLKCQRAGCGAAIFDFDGCFAVTCGACKGGFCAWCMADCGSDAHQHVKSCSFSMHPGSYHGKLTEFNEVHGKRRCRSVIAYLQSIPDPILRAAIEKAIEKDLTDLGINIKAGA